MRSRSDSALKPPKTTLCTAPMRAQASIAMASSGHERHVDRDAVALDHAQRLEHVGELRDLAVEREVGQRAALARLAFPDEGGLVAARTADVTVDAVDAGVELAAHEPLRVGRRPLEHRVPRPHPLEFLREAGPEGLGIGGRARVDLGVVDVGGGAERGARLEAAVLAEEGVDLGGRAGVWSDMRRFYRAVRCIPLSRHGADAMAARMRPRSRRCCVTALGGRGFGVGVRASRGGACRGARHRARLAWLERTLGICRGADGSRRSRSGGRRRRRGHAAAPAARVRDGRMVAFEFLRIVARHGALVYIAQPGGRPPTEFALHVQAAPALRRSSRIPAPRLPEATSATAARRQTLAASRSTGDEKRQDRSATSTRSRWTRRTARGVTERGGAARRATPARRRSHASRHNGPEHQQLPRAAPAR